MRCGYNILGLGDSKGPLSRVNQLQVCVCIIDIPNQLFCVITSTVRVVVKNWVVVSVAVGTKASLCDSQSATESQSRRPDM
jgi:hypothetical protein